MTEHPRLGDLVTLLCGACGEEHVIVPLAIWFPCPHCKGLGRSRTALCQHCQSEGRLGIVDPSEVAAQEHACATGYSDLLTQ